MPAWTPARGAAALAEEFGRDEAIGFLVAILAHEALPDALFLRVMTHTSGHEPRSMAGPYATPGWFEWPEVWAARALGYLGGSAAERALIGAAEHPHWRVRRTVIRSLGWIGGADALDVIVAARQDDDRRVRQQSPVSETKVLERLSQ